MITLIIVLISSLLTINSADLIVQTTYGKIRGKIMESVNDKSFAAFQGIPFAEPPIGDLRFKPPQPSEHWEEILDDQNAEKICVQISSTRLPNESEDCLYLNVYTPQVPIQNENSSIPVLVFFHGGAFVEGSANINQLGPHLLMDYNVVLVTVQYRLGFFGFLSTEDLVCPGNNGHKDQQFSLRWVQENIRNFGGDPDKVTIFGQSSGAASVGYHLLGSKSQGLFRAAIQDSGSSLGSPALQVNPRKLAFDFGNHINSSIHETNTTSEELIAFFRTVGVSEIVKACTEIFGVEWTDSFFNTFKGFVFGPVIEPNHDDAFLTDSPFNMFQSGNFNTVPVLLGINSEEALFLASDSDSLEKRMALYDEHTEQLVSPNMHLTDLNVSQEIGEDIRKMYVGSGLLHENLGPSIKYFSDGFFGRASIKQAEFESAYTNIYLYEFAYSGELGALGPKFNIPGAEKVTHGEEMGYIFHSNTTRDLSTYPKQDILTMNRMLTMWTNFAKYLNPTPEPLELLQNVTWPNIRPGSKMPYLLINETLEVKYDLKKPMVDEYTRLYDTYAIPPLETF